MDLYLSGWGQNESHSVLSSILRSWISFWNKCEKRHRYLVKRKYDGKLTNLWNYPVFVCQFEMKKYRLVYYILSPNNSLSTTYIARLFQVIYVLNFVPYLPKSSVRYDLPLDGFSYASAVFNFPQLGLAGSNHIPSYIWRLTTVDQFNRWRHQLLLSDIINC